MRVPFLGLPFRLTQCQLPQTLEGFLLLRQIGGQRSVLIIQLGDLPLQIGNQGQHHLYQRRPIAF